MFSQFEMDFNVFSNEGHRVTTAVLHLRRSDGKHCPLHYWMDDIANLLAACDHYTAHRFNIIKHTVYTLRDTWKDTCESAPLEREAISSLSNVNCSICAKCPGIELSPLFMIHFITFSQYRKSAAKQ